MLGRLTSLLRKNANGIGIELAPERINIVQLRKHKQQYKLVANCSAEVPEGIFEEGKIADGSVLAELIQDTLASNNIKSTRVATAVPMREAIMRIVPIPAELDDQELHDAVLNTEAALYLPYPREEVDLDYQKLGYFEDEDGIEKVNVLLVATKREITDLYMDTFLQAGLEIDVLELNSFALIRTIREQLRQFSSTEAVVLVNLEFDSTEIAIIVEGVPQFSRTIPTGTYQLQTALSQLQGMIIPDQPSQSAGPRGTSINPGMVALLRVLGELADELRRSVDFYLNQSDDLEVAQLLLAGPGGGIGQLDEFITRRLGLPTMQIDPITSLSLEVDEEIPLVQRPGLGTVLGLGLREV
ncbi:MAG: type IV pilus assembly protein PilM [Prochloron sp. SP5CPC1]|nr:type IV pilus assembly protein PilM [Candidatus Paraprochloron terpiosi SP5CPC1]